MRIELAGNLYSLLLLFISVLASVQRGLAACEDLEGAMITCGPKHYPGLNAEPLYAEAARGRCFRTFGCEDALRRISSGLGKRSGLVNQHYQHSFKRNDDVLELNPNAIDLLDDFSDTNEDAAFDTENTFRSLPINNPLLSYLQDSKMKRNYKPQDEEGPLF